MCPDVPKRQAMNIPERDWKKFGPLRDKALARFCDRVLAEIEATKSNDALSSHEKYLEIYSLVRDRDKKLAQIFDGYSRSRALMQLAMIRSQDLLEPEEIDCFSESTREFLERFRD
jgi:adenine-specific DNA methylase